VDGQILIESGQAVPRAVAILTLEPKSALIMDKYTIAFVIVFFVIFDVIP